MPPAFSSTLEDNTYAYLTTTGRLTGRPHRIEIWFCVIDETLCVISGGGDRSDWVKNLIAQPALDIEIGDSQWRAEAAIPASRPDHPARGRLAARYQGWREGTPLTAWATDGLVLEFRPDAPGHNA